MSTTAKNLLTKLEDILAKRQYADALILLESVKREQIRSMDAEELAEFYLTQAKCYYRLGEYKKAMLKLRVSMRVSRPLSTDVLYASQKYWLGQILSETGNLDRALEEFNEAYVFYRRLGDTEMMMAPLERIVLVHLLRGNYAQAIEVSLSLLKQASGLDLTEDIHIATFNLVRVLILVGRFQEADHYLSRLDASYDDTVHARINNLGGIIRVFLNSAETGSSRLLRALESYSAIGAARDEVVCLEYLGLNEYFAGNYDKAKEYYDDILGREEITASARAQTLRMLTDVYVAKDQWQQATETAELAEAAITKINERIELGALDRARALISANAGDPEAAKDYFNKSIKLLSEIGARYELALTFLTCGRCEVYDLDERRYYLRRARDLFAEMEVPKRVAEVEEEIGRVGPRLRGDDRVGRGDDRVGRGDDRVGRGDNNLVGPNPRGSDNSSPPVVIATSDPMRELMAEVDAVAPSDLCMLLTGETGTGKDLLAEYIHYRSGRPGEFITVNSAAIPNEMIESELFGHAKGAFTGADKEKPGLLEIADNGTFYLNEITSCTPEFQAKLLEVLESGQIRRLGETRNRRVDFRLIAASNHDFAKLMRKGLFRNDLFYRLRECQLLLPPLRQRPDDIPALVEHFLLTLGWEQNGPELQNICHQLGELLARRPWPGNVRALRAEVRRLWFAAGSDLVRMLDLAVQRGPQSEREELLMALRDSDGNQSETARRLGISEGTVRNRIKKFDL